MKLLKIVTLLALVCLAGCELEPDPEPLTADSALEAEMDMRRDADALLRERRQDSGSNTAIVKPADR